LGEEAEVRDQQQ